MWAHILKFCFFMDRLNLLLMFNFITTWLEFTISLRMHAVESWFAVLQKSWISKHDIMNMSLEIFDLYHLHGSRMTLSFTCLPSFKSPQSKYVMYIRDLSTFRALGGVGHRSNIRRFSHLLAIYIFKLTLKSHWILKNLKL